MRELILLRHAHAEPPRTGQADLDRPLSAEGLAEAEAVAAWMRDKSLVPDLALCSPSRRTRETLDVVTQAVGAVERRLEEALRGHERGQEHQQPPRGRPAQRERHGEEDHRDPGAHPAAHSPAANLRRPDVAHPGLVRAALRSAHGIS